MSVLALNSGLLFDTILLLKYSDTLSSGGERVLLLKEENAYYIGKEAVVKEFRKKGWYDIRVRDEFGKEETIKWRGTRMEKL
jgi:hypothetical protein